MNNISRGLRALFVVFSVPLLALASCQSPLTPEKPQHEGTSTLVVDFSASLQESGEEVKGGELFTVTGEGPDGGHFTRETREPKIQISSLKEGSWSVVVQSLDGEGHLKANGTLAGSIAPNQTTIFTVKLSFKNAIALTIGVEDTGLPLNSLVYPVGSGGQYRLSAFLAIPMSGSVTYQWYSNGVLVGSGATYVMDVVGKLALGQAYRIDVTATSSDGKQAGSASAEFKTTGYRVVYKSLLSDVAGTMPKDTIIYSSGNAILAPERPSDLSRPGYSFLGWNTEADRSGATYYPGDSIEFIDKPVQLFPVWYLPTPNASPNDQPTKGILDIGGRQVRFDVSRLKQPSSGAKTLYVSGLDLLHPDDESVRFENDIVLQKHQDSMERFVQEMFRNMPLSDQVLIAYSQGGLRALGYANAMSRLGYGERIKGIIFLTSPVRGFPALSWGEDSLIAAVNQRGDMVRGNIDDLSEDLGHLATDPWFLDLLLLNSVLSWDFTSFFSGWSALAEGSDSLKESADFIPRITRQQVLAFTGFSQAALDDLGPGNSFTKNYAGVPTGARYWAPDPFAVPDENGDVPIVQVQPGQISFDSRQPYFSGLASQYPGYGFGENYSPISCQAVLPSNIAVAFVVGSNSDPLQMVDPLPKVQEAKDKIDQLLGKLDDWRVQLAYKTLTLGLGVNVDNAVHDGRELRDLLYGGYKQVAGSLLGDMANDGFIPRFAQFRSPSEIGGFAIEGTAAAPQNVYEFSNLLHASTDIQKDARAAPTVWGTGAWNLSISKGAGYDRTNGTIPYLFELMSNSAQLTAADRTDWNTARDNVMAF